MTLNPRHRARPKAAQLLASLTLAASAGTGCAASRKLPACTRADLAGCAVDEVSFAGNGAVTSGDLAERIATAESAHTLGGILEGVPVLNVLDALTVDYERFDRFVLERDLARIERFYRARGFYDAKVRAARVERSGRAGVRVHIVIVEGEPVKVAAVDLRWRDWALERGRDVTRPITDAKNRLKVGARFEEDQYGATKRAMQRALTDRGFAYAEIQGHVDVDLVKHEARVTYTIDLGPACTFGEIKLQGLGELPERPLRAALGIDEGDRFSTEALEEAERALADFGVFGAIEVKPELSPSGQAKNPRVPVTFVVQPAALRAVRLGGGAEAGGRVEAHLVAGWEDRNFLGGLRRFSVEARPGLLLYPSPVTNLFETLPTALLPELQLRFEMRQPAAIEARTTAVLRGAYKHYLLKSADTTGELTAQAAGEAPIVGYNEVAGSIGLERPFLKSTLSAALHYNVQLNLPFSYNDVEPPAGFEQRLLPYFQALLSYDRRRDAAGKPDRISPRAGFFVAADAQLAGYPVGDARDFRIQPELRAYVPISKKVTLGFRLLTGFLFPFNYGSAFAAQDDCASSDGQGGSACTESEQASLGRDLQLLQFRAFFSGGATSNRGYAYNEVGPHDFVSGPTGEASTGIAPTGGLTLWESSLELRFPLAGNFGAALFVDGSDVTRKVGALRLSRPHLSTGIGLRYDTPVGPLRVDVGYRIPCAQVLGVCAEADMPAEEGTPGRVLGLPLAVSVAIGEAF